jgi:hypothetical protein
VPVSEPSTEKLISHIISKRKLKNYFSAYQSKSSEYRNAVNELKGKVKKTGGNDKEIENVPSAAKVVFTHGQNFENTLHGENRGEHLQNGFLTHRESRARSTFAFASACYY